MLGKKVFAAMLATVLGASLFGANAAKAVIDLDAEDKSAAVATYATETLENTVDGFKDYSVVMGPSGGALLDVTAAIGLGGPDDSFVTVRFDLGGMVFSEIVVGGDTNGHLDIDAHDNISIRAGGKVGDDYVSFIASRMGSADRDSVATLSIGQFGVKPGVHGSVTMTVTDSLGPEMNAASYPNAVRTMRALDPIAMANDLTATVEERFKMFLATAPATGTTTTGTLGSFMVGANMTLLDADGDDGAGQAVTLEDIIATGETSSVTISGDFSFVSMAWLDTVMTCDTPSDMRKTEGDEKSGTELDVKTPDQVNSTPHLCIAVPTGEDAVAIPETDPYMVTTEYAAGTTDAGWPPNDGEHALGSITRDGTTVHIPYLTTFADYNQRIVISNRSANEAPYWITFRPEDGVMATPGMYATGTLDGNSTMVLRAMDVVTLEGRNRTAATFVAEAKSTQIDVATVIVNMMTGSTDTVNYDSD